MNEQEFGKHLRELRLAKSLTKEAFCGDEEDLSVRQLTRLETGKSQPKLHTLEYLAERLEINVADLLDEVPTVYELPAEYLKLKYQLIRTPIYQNPQVIEQMNQNLNTIYSKYYDELPDAEQEVVDILQSALYSYDGNGEYFGESTLKKYRNQLETKPYYTVEDLLVLHLYKNYIDEGDVKIREIGLDFFQRVAERLLQSVDYIPIDYLFLMRDLLIGMLSIELVEKDFRYTNRIYQALEDIRNTSQDFQKEPIVKMLKWKHCLVTESDQEKAKTFYEEAITLAHLFGNEFLVGKLKEEWEKDLEIKN